MRSLDPRNTKGEERRSRILSAALEVFSKSSFGEATTEEIARRARVSKRDLYANFPDKHAILIKVIETVLENGEANLRRAILDNQKTNPSLETTLEIIGLSLVSELLSPLEGFVCRLAFAESLADPRIGKAYFDHWYSRRIRILTQTLAKHVDANELKLRRRYDRNRAPKQFLASVIQLPQLTVALGQAGRWNPRSVQDHVNHAVACFMRAYFSES